MVKTSGRILPEEIFRDNLEKIVEENLLLKSIKNQVTYWLPINNENNDLVNKSQIFEKIGPGGFL